MGDIALILRDKETGGLEMTECLLFDSYRERHNARQFMQDYMEKFAGEWQVSTMLDDMEKSGIKFTLQEDCYEWDI